MKTTRYCAVIILGILFIAGCFVTKKAEKPILQDASPPEGYNPLYIYQWKHITNLKDSQKLALSIREISAKNSNIQVAINFFDVNGACYFGASEKEWKKVWCGMEEVVNGKARKITDFKVSEVNMSNAAPTALAIVMDHSGSMGEMRARKVQEAVLELINRKRDSDAFTLIKYDNKVVVTVPLTTDKKVLSEKLAPVGLDGFGGMTAIADGVMEGINQLKDAQGYTNKSIVIFTDGLDNSSKTHAGKVIKEAAEKGITIFAVNFGSNVDENYMKPFADSTNGKYYHIYQTSEFEFLFHDIYLRMNNYYILEYRPRSFGQRTINIKVCPGNRSVSLSGEFSYEPELNRIINLNILFEVNKSVVKKEYLPEIEMLAAMLKHYPGMKIELGGHTDSDGSDDANMKLSQARADAVKAELVKLGIGAERILAKGYGETQPLEPNTSDESKARNRRTEIKILEK